MVPTKNTAKDLWKPKRKIEEKYKRALKQLARSINKKLIGFTTSYEIVRELKRISNSPEFNQYAESVALKMVTSLFSDAGRTWREAARVNSKGQEIYKALKNELHGPIGIYVKEQIDRNAKIIKSMPIGISEQLTEHIKNETFKGRRSEEIAKDLEKKVPYMFEYKAKLIARTEVSKTSTALTESRCKNIGIRWYNWRTSNDQRVRSSHDHMNNVLVCWDNPPSPEVLINEKNVGYYHAGNIYNCRCYPEPIVRLDFVKWPHKVYYNGKVTKMTRLEFEKIM